MNIPTYILAVRDSTGTLTMGRQRPGSRDLPVGFEPGYARFLFEFGESRIRCEKGDELLLLKGSIETADLQQRGNYVEAFKQRLLEPRDYSSWEVVERKRAQSLHDRDYRQKLRQHLWARYSQYREDRAACG